LWDYNKTKKYLKLCLGFFAQHLSSDLHIKEEYSKIKNRHSIKVNNLFSFTHGNCPDKSMSKEFFEENGYYLNPTEGEDFKIDIQELVQNFPQLAQTKEEILLEKVNYQTIIVNIEKNFPEQTDPKPTIKNTRNTQLYITILCGGILCILFLHQIYPFTKKFSKQLGRI
jgi:hypothetical protein